MLKKKEKRINNREPLKIWFWFFVGLFAFSLFSYGYFVRGAIVNIVTRQTMESDLASLNSRVLDLESQYLKVKNNITPELAQNLGFVTATNQKFVTKNTQTSGLSLVTPAL
ncbi:MAG: hypothetical protein A2541_01835 [Candidatus Taylorbacteria bacterium RIFOXYD2_FULL_36_9]|uniref:Cell division protein FtsL n=1 Tax=Candidatus Taylorbacteria bacterium RIFOXYD2_FULL_36_9 TaxID=1802338 RepID=A0A1G2PG19_9BACT|nr:MAG: hypothetical protein A2541_01835 [Candidatus Taylorbacteria bacterium RIFOXYD2_FULL_36_9]